MTVSPVILAQRDLERIEAELAAIRERIAPFRRALFAAREDVRCRCVRLDHARQAIVSWRAPTTAEAAEMDAAALLFREQTEHLLPEEARLKAAVTEAKRAVQNAEFEAAQTARKAARQTRKDRDFGQASLF